MTPADTPHGLPLPLGARLQLAQARLDALREARACVHSGALAARIRDEIDRMTSAAESEIHALRIVQRAHEAED